MKCPVDQVSLSNFSHLHTDYFFSCKEGFLTLAKIEKAPWGSCALYQIMVDLFKAKCTKLITGPIHRDLQDHDQIVWCASVNLYWEEGLLSLCGNGKQTFIQMNEWSKQMSEILPHQRDWQINDASREEIFIQDAIWSPVSSHDTKWSARDCRPIYYSPHFFFFFFSNWCTTFQYHLKAI